MNNVSGYAVGSAPSTGPTSSQDTKKAAYWPLERCKKAYLDYIGNKQSEIEEQKNARRYFHGAQWTEAQIKALNDRKQPIVTFNRIARKINGVIGLIERLRQDPKAYPRTPKQEAGAELATAVIRYVLDEQEWKANSQECALDGAVDGIGGIAIEIEQGDHGDPEIALAQVEPDSFFYNPRSFRPDFSDSNYMGEGKWTDLEVVQDMFPDRADELGTAHVGDSDLTTNPDREQKWFSFSGTKKIVRLVDIWYEHKGRWCWAIFTGSMILAEGESWLVDEKNKPMCRYIMFSANVDHDGDRYGFVRHMKSAQDEYNSRRSRALFTANSRRLIINAGAVDDVEKTRKEWARPDGVVVVNGKSVTDGAKADDQSFDFAGQLKLMENAIAELENYGPNQALIGDQTNQSGRAIQLLQQAGMAELGPYILAYRGWKLRVYRAVFNAIQKNWTAERWVRVTDDDGLAQFIQINGVQIDPMTGQSTLVNALGSLDVDIILDEGPDTINAQQDVYETLSQVLPSVAPMLSPLEARATVGLLIDTSALPASAKKTFRDARQQAEQQPPPPNPELEKTQIQLQAKQQETAITLQAKQQEKAQDLEFEKMKAAASLEQKDRESEREIQLKRELAAIDAQLERERMENQLAHEQMKLHAGVQSEREKLGAHLQTEREKAEINLYVNGEKSRGDTDAKRSPEDTKLAASIAEMAKSIEEMSEVIASPKKIVRDAKGNIVGAEPVKKLKRWQ